jgi:ribosomal protein L11 methyltransferase
MSARRCAGEDDVSQANAPGEAEVGTMRRYVTTGRGARTRGGARPALHCRVPYRIDLPGAGSIALDRVVDLGALDVEALPGGGLAALMPDGVTPAQVAHAADADRWSISPARSRDEGSVWVLGPRPIQVGRLRLVPADGTDTNGLRLVDGTAFGTGLHPTTALCLQVLQDIVSAVMPGSVLDVGTGSGVLALAALMLGVPRAVGIDIADDALAAAAENARVNGMSDRLALARCGPEAVTGPWPLVLANVLAAPLIEMAPAIARCLGHHAEVVLSGIPTSVEEDVTRAYVRHGLRTTRSASRDGWTALVLRASW